MDFPIDGNTDLGNSQEPSYFLISLWHYCTLVSHRNLSSLWLDCNLTSQSKDCIYCHPVQFPAFILHQLTLFNFLERDEFYKSWERKHLFSRENRNNFAQKVFSHNMVFNCCTLRWIFAYFVEYLFIHYLFEYLFIHYLFE